MVLLSLTQPGPPKLLKKLRSKALPELVEMARWKASHGAMAATLVGRIAGMGEEEIEEANKKGDRESLIARALTE
jgi:hypothetical protein